MDTNLPIEPNPPLQTPPPPAARPRRMRDAIKAYYLLGGLIAALVTASFFVGYYSRGTAPRPEPAMQCEGRVIAKGEAPPFALKDVDFADFWKIWQTVKDKHVAHKTTDVELFYGAIEGMVGALKDPYSVFFDPDIAQKFADELNGTFDGIGAEIGIKKDRLTIIAPLPDTPAAKAGLKAGDKVLAIDGVDTTGMFVDDAVSRIRGPKGTKVKLLVMRDGWTEAKEMSIVRNTIVVESVKWKMTPVGKKRIAVITISRFNEDTAAGFSQAVRSILLESPDGLVLDLRNNPGGFLETAVQVAGEWVPHDVIVKEKMADGTSQDYNSDGNSRLVDVPTVVLVNGGSASASEIVAGALKDYGKAKIVGEQTYGKGSVQDYTQFNDGSALKLTVALWYTPKGNSIDKDGIAPDEKVVNTPEDFNEDKDPQLDRALQLIVDPNSPPPAAKADDKPANETDSPAKPK